MAALHNKIVPHLWFDRDAGRAAEFYTSVFPDSRIKSRVTLEGTPSGTVELVTFELLGAEFKAISAGPLFEFNESISFIVQCETQEELDYYWAKLSSDGGEEVECGWLKDRFGLSWQIVPAVLDEMLQSKDRKVLSRVTEALLKTKKFDIAALRAAYQGD